MKPCNGVVVSLSKMEPDEVYIEGFKSFKSEYARAISEKLRDLGETVLSPKHFSDLKTKLLLILEEIKIQRPLFYKANGRDVELMLKNPPPEKMMTRSGVLMFGDIFGGV
jgi:hypothetical protein